MPRLRDEILDCVVYLYRSYHEADEGIAIGGSGFALGMPCESLLAQLTFMRLRTSM